jgi:hypothetical protein
MRRRPHVIGGVLNLVGYAWAVVRRVERAIPEELIELRQNNQLTRLKALLRRIPVQPPISEGKRA